MDVEGGVRGPRRREQGALTHGGQNDFFSIVFSLWPFFVCAAGGKEIRELHFDGRFLIVQKNSYGCRDPMGLYM